MAIKTLNEILEGIARLTADKSDDKTIELVEDVTDTINEYERINSDTTDWKSKYEENDKTWRTKYKERFFAKQPNDNEEHIDEQNSLSFDKLFKEE